MAKVDKDSLANTFIIAVFLCLVCSIVVSSMAVALKQDGLARPDNWLGLPEVRDGAAGVAFVDAAVRSNSSGQWAEIAQV